MVSVLTTGAIYCGFDPLSGYKIRIWCFSAKDVAFGSKRNDWFTRNQDNVSEWSDNVVLFHCNNQAKRGGPVHSVYHHHFIKCSLFYL